MACFNSWVPPAGVYLVKLLSMALMAAFLILSGVGKSGSPAPKSTTSTPSRRRRSASAATFIVEDTLISDIRSAKSRVACITRLSKNSISQPGLNRRRHQSIDVSTQPDNLFHQMRTDEGVRLA